MIQVLVYMLREVGFTKPYLVLLNTVLTLLALSLAWTFYVGLGDMHVGILGAVALSLGVSLNWMALR